jgi:hypothetical protein
LEVLAAELGTLGEMGFDISLTGFAESELRDLNAGRYDVESEDDAPEPPKKPVSKLGDVWCMGGHRLVCGDSTDADTVAGSPRRYHQPDCRMDGTPNH